MTKFGLKEWLLVACLPIPFIGIIFVTQLPVLYHIILFPIVFSIWIWNCF